MKSKILPVIPVFGVLALEACLTSPEDGVDGPSARSSRARQALSQPGSAGASPAASATAFVATSRARVPLLARALVGSDTIERRTPSYRFTRRAMPRIRFGNRAATGLEGELRRSSIAFFRAYSAAAAAEVAATSVERADHLLRLPRPIPGDIAYAVPASGTIVLKKGGLPEDRATTVGSGPEAVALALEAIANQDLLHVAAEERLELVSVHLRRHAVGPDSVVTNAWRVVFGRTYRRTPILGRFTSVTLDPEGKLAAFHKGWRDIVGEDGEVPLVSQEVADGRRDAVMGAHLVEKERWCGYVEDPNPNLVQASPGLGCQLVYEDPLESGLAKEWVEWINYAEDPESLPLRARAEIHPVPQAGPLTGMDE